MMSKGPEYAYLISVHRETRDLCNLLDELYAEFGKSFEWHERTGYHSLKPLEGRKLLFRLRGNPHAKKLELFSYNIGLVKAIKKQFPIDFKMEVEIKRGWLYKWCLIKSETK